MSNVGTKAKVNADLKRERDKCSFKIEELTNYVDEGAKYTEQRRKLEELVLSDKTFVDPIPEEYLSHVQRYENAVRKAVRFYRLMDSIKLDVDNDLIWTSIRSGVANAVFKDNSPLSLHFIMFIPTIEQQGTKEQHEYWLKRAKNMEIIGTYAQTELGHGTFIRGLETTAHYDPKTEEFIIHSPKLSSYKWWPGGLAHSSNYCIVMARLFTQGKDCGIKPFIVQIRDENTHLPLPGIKVGEIGAKLGFNTVNNGFLGFENVRIPREQMLMKNAQVLKDGTFVAAKNEKLTYGSMVFVRVTIVAAMAKHLAKAATIAIRYSAVRKQSQIHPDKPEVQILEFVTQQHKLFIPLASSFAFLVCARWLRDLYVRVRGEIMQGNSEGLPQVHALACCLKAISTYDASRFVEQCRLACGGHGYMLSSSLPYMYGLITAAVTYEGENTVLLLQTARSLVKTWNEHSKGKTPSNAEAYLFRNSSPHKWENTVDGIVVGFQRVAAGKLEACVKNLQRLVKQGFSYEDAWNQTSVRLISMAEAHCRAVVLLTYASETAAASQRLAAPLSTVLHQLVHLYALYWALERTGDLLTAHCRAVVLLTYASETAAASQRLAAPLSTVLHQLVHLYALYWALERTGDLLTAHCRAVVLLTYASETAAASQRLAAPLSTVLHQLVHLYALYWALERTGDLLTYTSISADDISTMQRQYEEVLTKIRPNAVGIVDGFDIRDEMLQSTLGAYDGRVYERLMEEALKSPLNQEPVNQSFHQYLKPFMQGKL